MLDFLLLFFFIAAESARRGKNEGEMKLRDNDARPLKWRNCYNLLCLVLHDEQFFTHEPLCHETTDFAFVGIMISCSTIQYTSWGRLYEHVFRTHSPAQ